MPEKNHPIDVHVGKRLRLRRTMLGLSQDNIATAVGVTFQQVQKYERGVNRMGASRLYEFSKILQVPVSYFFEEYDELPKPTKTNANQVLREPDGVPFEHENLLSGRETVELMRAFYQIPSQQARRRVIDLIKAMSVD